MFSSFVSLPQSISKIPQTSHSFFLTFFLIDPSEVLLKHPSFKPKVQRVQFWMRAISSSPFSLQPFLGKICLCNSCGSPPPSGCPSGLNWLASELVTSSTIITRGGDLLVAYRDLPHVHPECSWVFYCTQSINLLRLPQALFSPRFFSPHLSPFLRGSWKPPTSNSESSFLHFPPPFLQFFPPPPSLWVGRFPAPLNVTVQAAFRTPRLLSFLIPSLPSFPHSHPFVFDLMAQT